MIVKNQIDNAVEKCFSKRFSFVDLPSLPKPNLYNILSSNKQDNYIHHFPYGIFWKITSQCNLRCKHCYYYKYQKKFSPDNDFSIEELLKLAEFFVDELNVITITLTGGEPFLQKDIFKLLEYLKSKNVYIQILTNATLITEELAEELEKILRLKSDVIQVSLDGATQETHDKIRGEGNFKKTVNGIKKLTSHNINVLINYTATSENVEEIPQLYVLCKDLKVKQINLGRFKVCSEEQAYLEPQLNKVFIYVAGLIDNMGDDKSISLKLMLLKAYDFLNYEIGINLLDDYLSHKNLPYYRNLMCHRHEKVTISADGKLYLCSDTEKDELCLGNLKEQSFFEIWENRFNNIFFQERCLEKLVCNKCKYVVLCGAGCPVKAYTEYGSINAPDSDCPYGKILMNEYNRKI